MRAAAVHPLLAILGVVLHEREMRTAIAEGFANGDALGIERVGDAADRGLRAFLVNVPGFEMLQWPGIHHDQRRMNDRAGIHQRAGQSIAARLDDAGESLVDYLAGVIGQRQRKHAGRQPLGADGDGDLEGPVLARQPRQRAGLGKGDAGVVAGVMGGFGENHRAEGRRRKIHHLAVLEMWRELPRDVGLCEGRRGTQDQFDVKDRFRNVGGHQRELRVVGPLGILDDDARAGGLVCGHGIGVAAPEADLVTRQGEITGRGERSVAAAQNCDFQWDSPSIGVAAWSCFNLKCCTLPSAVRGSSVTKTMSRGTLKRASCVSTCTRSASAVTLHSGRSIT